MKLLTPAEVEHIKKALEDYTDIVSTYPEVITNKQEDRLLIAVEIMTNENTNS